MLKNIKIAPCMVKFFAVPFLTEFDLSVSFTTRHKWDVRMAVYLSLYRDGIRYRGLIRVGGYVEYGQIIVVTSRDYKSSFEISDQEYTKGKWLGFIHLIPEHWLDMDLEQPVLLDMLECREYCYKTDGYLSYSDQNREKMTVGYHCLWWNNGDNSHLASTVFQACKYYAAEEHQTYVLLINFSPLLNWCNDVEGSITIINSIGNKTKNFSYSVKPFSYELMLLNDDVSVSERNFNNVVGVSTGGQVLPFIIGKNTKNGSYFIEHGVGPDGYLFGMNQKTKKASAENAFNVLFGSV